MERPEQDQSTRNFAIVSGLYAKFAAKDIPAILAVLSENVTWGEPENPFNPAAGTRHGHAGFLEWVRIGTQTEQILSLEPRHFLTNDGMVAVAGHMRCLAKATGRIYESDFVHLVTIEAEKIARFQEFFDTYVAAEAFRSRP